MKFLLVLLVALGAFVAISAQCSVNEVYKECGGCDQFCNSEPVFCGQGCNAGCYCQDGYIRSAQGGDCVTESNCPRAQNTNSFLAQDAGPGPNVPVAYGPASNGPVANGPVLLAAAPNVYQCGANEEYQTCGVGWQCENYCGRGPNACAYCEDGCYCKYGYVRTGPEFTAECIEENQCPRALASSSFIENSDPAPQVENAPLPESTDQVYVCGANEDYQRCGVGWQCEDYCGRGPNACAYCEDGCYCQPGYVRTGPEFTAECIPKNQCPRALDESSSVVENSDQVYLCGANEVYQTCGVGWQCEDYCGRGPNACAYCEDGCYCQPGFVRSGPEFTAECIPENQCPRALYVITESSVEIFCNINEVYKECGGCDQFCNREPVFCGQGCNPGCYCQDSYVRSFNGGICIPGNSCPRVQDDSSPLIQSAGPRCGANEVYQTCGVGSQCENYCGRGPNACAYCQDGCYCKRGYIRSGPEYKSQCIKENQCPRAYDVSSSFIDTADPRPQDDGTIFIENSGPPAAAASAPMAQSARPQCGANEVYQQCGVGSQCENYCGRGPNACAYCEDGCYCKKGYIRSGPEYKSQCIKENQCPRAYVENSDPGPQAGIPSLTQTSGYQCRPNEVFNQCGVGPECEDYCGRGANACAYCKPGCYCQQGFVRAGPSNICVHKSQCPVAQECLRNEEYNACGSACPDSCDGRNRICTQNCVAGCFCRKGFIREHDDTQTTRYRCIPKVQCPMP